jgi:hypothetical protein
MASQAHHESLASTVPPKSRKRRATDISNADGSAASEVVSSSQVRKSTSTLLTSERSISSSTRSSSNESNLDGYSVKRQKHSMRTDDQQCVRGSLQLFDGEYGDADIMDARGQGEIAQAFKWSIA